MSLAVEDVALERGEDAYAPVLRWLIFAGVSVFVAVALWRYGLIRTMIAADRTYISSVIVALYVAASLHCLGGAAAISREAETTVQLGARWARFPPLSGETIAGRGVVAAHVRDLFAKAQARGGGKLDQDLLLRALALRLREGAAFGQLASDCLLKLGLLGTIIGFILMLGPVAGLDPDNEAAVKASMGVMSGGMAVAMYTTLAGLIGSILLKAQYFMLEAATAKAFWDVVRLTETRLIPALERGDV